MGRKIPFENVVRNLRWGRYRGKIMQADYSNLGVRLFDERKFADNLGVSRQSLRDIGLIKITEQVGWRVFHENQQLRNYWRSKQKSILNKPPTDHIEGEESNAERKKTEKMSKRKKTRETTA